MTRGMTNLTGMMVRVKNEFFEKLAEYTLDRLVWCLAAIGLCWSEVQNYHEYIFCQRMYIMVGVGTFYCLKLGCFTKGKRIWCSIATVLGAAFTAYAVGTNLYNTYYYLNWPIGLLATVTLNLYVLVIYDCIKERRFPFSPNPSMVFILMVIAQQFSVYDYRHYYLYMLLGLLPYIMMKKGIRTRNSMLKGMIDGMCIGFFLVQGYAWMHRPYNYRDIRYLAFSNDKTTSARIYLAYFAVWITRYVQIASKENTVWNALGRVFTWFMSTFVLALVYLTGSRSTVLAIMAMTAIAVAVRYYRSKDTWYKRLGKCGLWLANCICVGLVSLALFPTAYVSVRYLPAYFNEPDYYDAVGYRMLSKPIQKWGEPYGWDFEYDDFAVKKDEARESVRYTTFEEAVHYNLGRIIPGADDYLEEVLGDELLYSGLSRAEYYYEQGIYDITEYEEQVKTLKSDYGPEAVDDGTSNVNTEKIQLDTNKKVVKLYQNLLEKLIGTIVLRVNANEEIDGLEAIGRGDSKENPWFEVGEYPGNSSPLRTAIRQYTIGKLNVRGHAEGTFQMWAEATWDRIPHAHNIFLIFGYDFGIPTMILMVLWYITAILVCLYNIIKYHRTEYLYLVLLAMGMIIFGWFESGFYYKTGVFAYMTLATVYTDVLHRKKQ